MSTSPLKSPGGMVEPDMVQNNNAIAIEVQSPKATYTESSETSMVTGSPDTKPRKVGSRINVIDDIDKPDYIAFKQKMNEVHARNKNFEQYTCSEACCEQTGWYCCFGTTKKSPIDQYGVAVVHYFRFLKYLAGFFFIASILSIPVLYFAVKMSADFGDSGISDYKTVLYYTTLGSFATGSAGCQNVLVGTLADNGGQTPITFSCEVGKIGAFDTFSYGRVTETQDITCDYYTHFSWDDDCNQEILTDIKSEYEPCVGESSCSFTVKSTYFDYTKTGCLNWNPVAGNSNNAFYFNILCTDITVETVGGFEVSKKNIGYIVASFDAGIYLILILMLFLLKYSENAAVVNVLGNNEGVDSYTIEVRSLPSNLEMSVLKTKLWKHFSSFKANKQTHNLSVVDVQLAESDTLLTLNTELGILKAQKVKVYRKYYKKWTGGKSPSPTTVQEVEFEDLQKLSKEKGKKAQKAFKPIEKMQKQQTKLQTKIDKLKAKSNSGVISAFVTFESRTDRDIAYSSFQRSALNRMCFACKCCCASKNDCNIFEGHYLRVTEATDPGNIKWENMSIKSMNRNLRRLFSWAITIGLWIVSFAFMVFVRNQQRDVSDQVQPTKDCSGYSGVTKAEAIADMDLGVNGQGLLECYCRENSSQAFTYPCTDWSFNRIFIAAIPFVIVFAIIIINFILQYVFKFLSSFEKHRSQSSESVSKILKIFVAQALNTGVIILIVNAKFSKIGVREVFEGTFDDVTAQWFFDVGITILITMIINVVNVPAIVLVFRIIAGIRRWFDRGCTMRMERTKQKKQAAWENLYIGPEFLIEFRYSQILTITFICLFYSAGIPFLFISSFVNIFFLYWLDKICLLRLYRLPKNLDKKLHSVVRQSIFIAILLHLGNAVWNYGNPQIFGGDSSSLELADKFFNSVTDDSSTPGLFAKLIQRAIQYQDISLSVMFVALLLIIIAKLFFSSTINKLFKACRRGRKNLHNSKYAHNQSYFSKIKRSDLTIERRYLEKEVYNARNDAIKHLLEARLASIREEIQKRPPGEEKIGGKFPGIFSYFVGHNPDYKKYYLQAKGLKEATPC